MHIKNDQGRPNQGMALRDGVRDRTSIRDKEIVGIQKRFGVKYRGISRTFGGLFLVAALLYCFVPVGSGASGPPPLPAIPGIAIGSWHFDETNLLSALSGYPPKAARNLTLFPSWQSNAVEIATANALLQ